nr:hypothetical protein [Bacillus subtilis]
MINVHMSRLREKIESPT